jgi:3-oxoacyl-[acyl-carrier protein] reductase
MTVLEDKVAIVTGSARGIGRATAELLAQQGAKVLINDLDTDLATQAASEIDGETVVYGGDLTKAAWTSSSTTPATPWTRPSTR